MWLLRGGGDEDVRVGALQPGGQLVKGNVLPESDGRVAGGALEVQVEFFVGVGKTSFCVSESESEELFVEDG